MLALCEGSGSALCEGESCSSQCEVDGLGERGSDELDTEQLVEEAMRRVTLNIGGEVQFELMPGEIREDRVVEKFYVSIPNQCF